MKSLVHSLCGFGLFLVALAAFGQGDRGTISGTVKDPVGGIVAGASVQATNASTGTVEQGKLEQSNVGAAESAVRLVDITRQFEMLQKAAQIGSDLSKKAIEEVARVVS